MPKLRKSASFRSRIPISRHQENATKKQNHNLETHFDEPLNKICRCSTLNDSGFGRNLQGSSSYSSSDESSLSDCTHKNVDRALHRGPVEDRASEDSLSLDEILDNISCGSNFSNPRQKTMRMEQSVVQSSIDKIGHDLAAAIGSQAKLPHYAHRGKPNVAHTSFLDNNTDSDFNANPSVDLKGGSVAMGTTTTQQCSASGIQRPCDKPLVNNYYYSSTRAAQLQYNSAISPQPSRKTENPLPHEHRHLSPLVRRSKIQSSMLSSKARSLPRPPVQAVNTTIQKKMQQTRLIGSPAHPEIHGPQVTPAISHPSTTAINANNDLLHIADEGTSSEFCSRFTRLRCMHDSNTLQHRSTSANGAASRIQQHTTIGVHPNAQSPQLHRHQQLPSVIASCSNQYNTTLGKQVTGQNIIEPVICMDSPKLATRRVLPHMAAEQQSPTPQQVQIKLQQNPVTRQLFGVVQSEAFHAKPQAYRNDGDVSGSYASLECPSPPDPPICMPESQKDPQARLSNYLRNWYNEMSMKEPMVPPWVLPIPPGILSPARLEPDLRLNPNSHGFTDSLTVNEILSPLQTKDGNFLDAPKHCLIECQTWASRNNLCLRILHAWAKEPPWPSKGTPVALTLFIPLRELKQSIAHYIEKEILPKGPLNPFASSSSGNFHTAWCTLQSLGPKLLIILDGYINQNHKFSAAQLGADGKRKGGKIVGSPHAHSDSSANGKHSYPPDVYDLLEGRLFPDARVIITTNMSNCMELMSSVHRHVMYDGLTWGRSASILEGGQWNGPSPLLDFVQESIHMRNAVRSPLGCLAIATLYETSSIGDLPIDELDVIDSIFNCIAPDSSNQTTAELGRLALYSLKMKRTWFTATEIKMYCTLPDSILNCLERSVVYGKTAKKKAEYVYHPICSGMLEYLAANYIASLSTRLSIMAAEVTAMATGDELDPELLKVLKFTMSLLGDEAHVLLSRLTPLWLTPQTVFALALAGGQSEANRAALCDILGISKHAPISPLETKPLWVQVRSIPTDLMGWGMALRSPTCTLKNLEITYQLDKQKLLESRKAIEIFLDSLALNESVTMLRISSLIEMDVKDSEIAYLSNCVSKMLLKPRLEQFEIVLTLIEEDPPFMKLQPVVAALCRTMPRQSKLNSLLLDLGLSTSQLVQISAAIEKCPNITRLSLPHMRCERGAVAALAALLNVKPLSFLSLPSCWGVRDDPPSSSGVSMGSGSGSSTGTSCLIKQGSLPGVPSPRSYAPGIFSSLPRGIYVPQSSHGRSATLPRQPLEQSAEKRSCDSVISKMWYPTPTCEGGPHNTGTMHELFVSIRLKVHSLDLSKAQLSLEDAMCLGETIRLSTTLHTFKFEGSSRVSEVLPAILGVSESPCLQMLSIGSQRMNLEDSIIVLCARALTSCITLRLLSLDGWCFQIEQPQTVSIIKAFLTLTSIRELSLVNCRLQTTLIRKDDKFPDAQFESRSLVVLKLAGAQIALADQTILRGPQLLQFIKGFTYLRELDLSAPARSGIDSSHSTPQILDDATVIQFFQNLHRHFSLLNTLKICNWVMHFNDFSKTLKIIAKALRNSPISHLKLDGISLLNRPKKQRNEAAFIQCCIQSLPHLRWLGTGLSSKNDEHIAAIGKSVLGLRSNEIEIKLSESTIEQAKLMTQAIGVDSKFDIKVSTFGTSSGILIHAEKSGVKSLSRRVKGKDQYF